MIKDDLKPTIEELLTFAHHKLSELDSREIDLVRVKVEEALFWLSYHHQILNDNNFNDIGKIQLKLLQFPKKI